MAKGAALIRLFKITHAEYGQMLDALDTGKHPKQLLSESNKREPDMEYFIPKLAFSLDEEVENSGIKFSGLNGSYYFLSGVTSEVTEFELTDDLKDHIEKKRPIFYTKWY